MNIGFIGIGKIAGAVIEGLCSSALKEESIFLSPRNAERSAALAKKYSNLTRLDGNQAVLDKSDIVVIALRPAVAVKILCELRFEPRHTVVSLIPLLKYADLCAALAPATDICRAIPLPAVVSHQCPIPLFQAGPAVTRIFAAIGQPLPVDNENQLHALWTLTGLITPFYELLGALSRWTIDHGVTRETADTYVADLFQSLSYTAQQSSPIDFGELAQHAATPNGMNEQAGREIRDGGAHGAWVAASERLMQRFPEI